MGDAGPTGGAGTTGGAGAAGAGGAAVACAPIVPRDPNAFVHPGGLHKKSDMDRMRYLVAAGVEPWLSAYNVCAPMRSRARPMPCAATRPGRRCRATPACTPSEFESDANAAYLQALMWIVTQDTAPRPEGRRDLQRLEEPDGGDGWRDRAAQRRPLRLQAGRGRRDHPVDLRRLGARRHPGVQGDAGLPGAVAHRRPAVAQRHQRHLLLAHLQRRSRPPRQPGSDRVARDDRDGRVPRRPDHVRPRASLLQRADPPRRRPRVPVGTIAVRHADRRQRNISRRIR